MRLSKKKNITIRNCKPCGESSPYHDWVSSHSPSQISGDGDEFVREPVEANPDTLLESDHLFHDNMSETGRTRLESIEIAKRFLSPMELTVIDLHGYFGLSLDQVAVKLKKSKSTINTYLNRARKKIMRYHVAREADLGI